MAIREIFARNLRQRRKELGMSQEELAHRADLDRTYISSIEHCKYGVTIDVLERLANELNIDPAELLVN
ncbi:helix-turn-helix transcriptional regulator [Parasphingorhabdus sp.]|uniref:helix-turn-helix domain-containing protein n=1 Tax=Parasphingorhabdus sp. TaxID=2709688 RepID=UPI002F94CE96